MQEPICTPPMVKRSSLQEAHFQTTGRYSLSKNTFIEKNYSALLVASKDNIFGKFGGSVTLGGNLMSQNASGLSSNSGELEVA